MIKIDFNYLLDNYNTNLLDNLRGFGNENEYLKFWVPGTDNLKSFYNLIDALFESREIEFRIYFLSKTFQNNFYNELEIFLNQVGSFNKKEDKEIYDYHILIKENLYQSFQKTKKLKLKETIQKEAKFKKKINIFRSEKKILKNYLESIPKINANDYYQKDTIINDKLFSTKFEDYNLNILFENRKIIKLFHNCRNDEILRKFINIFFDICIDKDIQEVSDHSVIYLEEKLRINSNHLIKNGIILPFHAGTYFDDLNLIIRNIISKYKKKNSIKFGINKNYFKKSFHWINLDEKHKLEKVNFIISEIIKKNNLEDGCVFAQSIESNYRVNLSVNSSFKKIQEKKNLLLNMEIELKNLDNTLEIFIDEILDKNKLRIKNSPQTKLLN